MPAGAMTAAAANQPAIDCAPRPSGSQPPRFAGFGDAQSPEEFLDRLETFCLVTGVAAEKSLAHVVPAALEGSAKLWLRFVKIFASWEDFKVAFIAEFSSIDAKRRLKHEADVCSSVEARWRRHHHCADFESSGATARTAREVPSFRTSEGAGKPRGREGSCLKTPAAEYSGARSRKNEARLQAADVILHLIATPRVGAIHRDPGDLRGFDEDCKPRSQRYDRQRASLQAAHVSSHKTGRADELKLDIEALKLQLEIEKLKTARFLQNGAQGRSETNGLGRYAKELKAVLVPMPTDDTMIPAWFKMADSLLKMLEVPEEMQGALILPFLTEEVKTSVISQSLSGTFSYGELKEQVLKERN
ncbi:hypothetical protein HPB50_014707 [Hyalomma asiaticum]|uniref:Uncharacterized protein n=1 Tax=Hyalomma asiaticum TaxID=266040 RepID=A0ACB7RP81_HYAAI|nr:hypothetical protein HPB50_014707 [Hyalomma asiaticum]